MDRKTKLLDLAEKRYYYFADRSMAMQNDLLRTYLWSGSLALTLNGFILRDHGGLCTPHGLIAAVSGLIALAVLIVCIDTMRGRGKRKTVGLAEYHEKDAAYTDHPDLFLDHLIADFTEITDREIAQQDRRATKLRVSSRALVASFILLAVSAMVLAAQSPTINQLKEVMTHG